MPTESRTTLASEIHGRSFVTTGNDHGVSTTATVFHYFVDGSIITGEYQGGEIVVGKIVGKITGPTTIELLFECVTSDGRLMCGESRGIVDRNDAGSMTLQFDWSWLTDDGPGGQSNYIEIVDN